MAVTWNDTALIARVRAAIMRGVVRGTEEVREEAISLILNTPKTGREYRRRGVVHQASAPGEPPASNTGRLVNAINTVYDFQALTGAVQVDVDYGYHLEFGTQKMEPRPFLRPALANKSGRIQQLIADEVNKVLK